MKMQWVWVLALGMTGCITGGSKDYTIVEQLEQSQKRVKELEKTVDSKNRTIDELNRKTEYLSAKNEQISRDNEKLRDPDEVTRRSISRLAGAETQRSSKKRAPQSDIPFLTRLQDGGPIYEKEFKQQVINKTPSQIKQLLGYPKSEGPNSFYYTYALSIISDATGNRSKEIAVRFQDGIVESVILYY